AGGAGFIGSNLCEFLLNKGNHIICVDNFYSGKKENIEHLIKNKNFEFVFHDILKPINKYADIIINLACPASPKFYQKDPIYTFKTNIIGSINLLDLAKKNNAIIFQASTSEIYGNALSNPQSENYWGNVNPNGIRSCYDEGKRGAESLFFDYNRQFGTKIKIARIFNCYGHNLRSDDGRVVCTFINQALRGDNLTVFGDGTQTRSLCYIDDLIQGIVKLLETDKKITGPVNLGNPEEMNIKAIAELIITLTESSSKIEYLPLPQDDPINRKPDISYAKNILDWEPKINIKEGFIKTIQ
ncbi:UDP-glucuronic acid decarboxylase family protein, partial [Treponema pedis]